MDYFLIILLGSLINLQRRPRTRQQRSKRHSFTTLTRDGSLATSSGHVAPCHVGTWGETTEILSQDLSTWISFELCKTWLSPPDTAVRAGDEGVPVPQRPRIEIMSLLNPSIERGTGVDDSADPIGFDFSRTPIGESWIMSRRWSTPEPPLTQMNYSHRPAAATAGSASPQCCTTVSRPPNLTLLRRDEADPLPSSVISPRLFRAAPFSTPYIFDVLDMPESGGELLSDT